MNQPIFSSEPVLEEQCAKVARRMLARGFVLQNSWVCLRTMSGDFESFQHVMNEPSCHTCGNNLAVEIVMMSHEYCDARLLELDPAD